MKGTQNPNSRCGQSNRPRSDRITQHHSNVPRMLYSIEGAATALSVTASTSTS
jgi:hypothetical protein